MGRSVTVRLIRHEKTEANLLRQYIGWTDQSIIQTDHCFQLENNVDKIYGSDLLRCRETAELYFPSVPYIPFKNLRELNFGDFEMKTYEQLKQEPLYRLWIKDPEAITPPKGESFQHFQERVLNVFRNIITESGDYVFIVHGGVIRYLLSTFSPTPQIFSQTVVKHRTIYTLTWSTFMNLREGKRCESLSVEPIMENDNL